MGKFEEIIGKILSKRPEISRDELMKMLDKERQKTGGYISDEVLLQMIAAGLGVKVSGETLLPRLLIGTLVPGLGDVTVTGRVVAVFPVKVSSKNGKVKFASMLLADRSGVLRVVFWNDKVDLVESGKIRVGQIVKVVHGYAKEDRWGKVELHIGEKGEVEVNPQDAEAAGYPTIEELATKIGAVDGVRRERRINLLGVVKRFFPSSCFKRQDYSDGKVMRFILADETGEMPVVVWNEKVDEVGFFLKNGVKLHIVNAKVKKGLNGGFEAHVNSGTFIGVFNPSEQTLKICELREGLKNFSVEGSVAGNPMVREVKSSKGELVKLAVFELEDETGKIWVSAWGENAEVAAKLKTGDKITLRNVYVKRGFGEKIEISTKKTTILNKK